MKDLFIVAGTGSRSLQAASAEEKHAVFAYLTTQFTALKEKYGDSLRVMTGMAEGFDKAFAVAAISLDIKVIAVVPNKGYGRYYWGKKSLTGVNQYGEFCALLGRCEVIYAMEDLHNQEREPWRNRIYLNRNGRKVHSNFVRNEEMVERADAFYVYDPKSSGTRHCFGLIAKAELPYKLVPTS